MKKTCWLISSMFLSTCLLAQQATNPAPAQIETPGAAPAVTNAAPAAPATNAPSAKVEKKKAAKKKVAKAAGAKKKNTAELKTVPLVAGPAVVVASHVNVRGRAGLKGEVVNHLTNGEPVTVLEEVTLKNSGPDEPSAWAKIVLPATTHVWVNSSFLDATNKTVRPKKLNVRGGPGENFSVLGTLKQGDAVKEIGAKGEWLQIEPPADAFAFVAAQYLKQEGPAAPATTPAETAPTTTTVAEAPPVVAAPTETPAPPAAPETPATNAPTGVTSAPAAAVEEPPPPRVVQREGIVRGTFSIQAPTRFELVSPDNGRTINYLYTTAPDLDLRRYKGIRIIVTGEEGLDERWRNTPVITIQRIQVLE